MSHRAPVSNGRDGTFVGFEIWNPWMHSYFIIDIADFCYTGSGCTIFVANIDERTNNMTSDSF